MNDEQISPTIHEATVERHFQKDSDGQRVADDGLAAVHDAVAACRVACEKSRDAKTKMSGNLMQTPMANAKQIHEVGFKNLQAASMKVDAARSLAEAILKKVENEIFSPPLPTNAAQIAMCAEIRSALSRLNRDEREKMLNAAIESDDKMIVTAVLAASPFLSGMASHELESRRAQWQAKNHAGALDRLARLKKALGDLDRVAMLSRKFVLGLTDQDAIAKAIETEEAAKAAAA